MFCSECGQQARGKFCAHCGTRLESTPAQEPEHEIAGRVGDWSYETRHEVLIRIPEVRAAIERHAKLTKSGISGEKVLEIYESLMPVKIPMAKLAGIIAPFYSKWGINTGKERTGHVALPIGHAIVKALCSLAEHGQIVRNVEQAEDGCKIEAELPSDVRSVLGELVITLHRDGNQTAIHATATCKGQWMDWGKSRSVLDKLFGDLEKKAAA